MTLIEELEQAADDYDGDCDCVMGGCDVCVKAARLRVRIEHVKRLLSEYESAAGQCYSEDEAALDAANALTGDL
jgi:hypothetical protein